MGILPYRCKKAICISLPMKIFLAYGECTNKGGWRGGGEGTKKYVPEVSFKNLAPMWMEVFFVPS